MAVALKDFKTPAVAYAEAPTAEFKPDAGPGIYAPMRSDKKFADGNPVNSLMLKQRREIVKDWFGEKWRDGSIGTAYKAWAYVVLSVIAIIVFYGISVWISAVFAYLAGYFWSELILNYAWTVEWYKNKALIETK